MNSDETRVAWDPSYDGAVIEEAFKESARVNEMLGQWADAVDTKIVGVFSVLSLLTGLAPSIGDISPHGFQAVALVLALLFWLLAGGFAILAFAPQAYRIDPNPSQLLDKSWLGRKPDEYRFYRLRDMGKTFSHNQSMLRRKTRRLTFALVFFGAEVLALFVALLPAGA